MEEIESMNPTFQNVPEHILNAAALGEFDKRYQLELKQAGIHEEGKRTMLCPIYLYYLSKLNRELFMLFILLLQLHVSLIFDSL